MSTHHTTRASSAAASREAATRELAAGQYAGRRPPVAAASLDLIDRSRGSLLLACRAGDSAERYLESHLGALRAAAALLAVRSTATGRSRPRSVWDVLPVVAPELSEWATFFAGSARRRVVIQRGGAPSPREADDLLRQAEVFLEIVQDLIGVPRAEPLPDYIAPVTAHPASTSLSASTAPACTDPGSTATGSTATGSTAAAPTAKNPSGGV
ncbi:MAG: SAV_6107 family HEPN domain-containing protein [Lapillicoccus sp.]